MPGLSRSAINRRKAKERAAQAAAAGDDGAQPGAQLPAADADASARLLMFLVENVGITLGGPDAAMADVERALIEPALTAYLGTLTPAVVKRVTDMLNPAMLLMGGLMYGARVAQLAGERARVARANRAAAAPQRPTPQPEASPAAGPGDGETLGGARRSDGESELMPRAGETDGRAWLAAQVRGSIP